MTIRWLATLMLFAALFAPPLAAQTQALARTAGDSTLVWGDCPPFMPSGCELAALRGDPAQPNADMLLRVPAQSTIERHWHSSAERMVLIEGEMEVRYDNQGPVTLRPGTYAYGPARLPHSARCRSTVRCVLFIAFEGPVDAHEGGGSP
jgi:mannose-6-phosphate isomerase-like protein (cupin superfamily)